MPPATSNYHFSMKFFYFCYKSHFILLKITTNSFSLQYLLPKFLKVLQRFKTSIYIIARLDNMPD